MLSPVETLACLAGFGRDLEMLLRRLRATTVCSTSESAQRLRHSIAGLRGRYRHRMRLCAAAACRVLPLESHSKPSRVFLVCLLGSGPCRFPSGDSSVATLQSQWRAWIASCWRPPEVL